MLWRELLLLWIHHLGRGDKAAWTPTDDPAKQIGMTLSDVRGRRLSMWMRVRGLHNATALLHFAA